jgi:8-oxo-dGTP pyrophosphatase MutT (NUDIX family)
MPRLRGHETAEHEAYEEAGIEGELSAAPIGRYSYEKKRRSGDAIVAEVTVYALRVSRQHYNWPERDQRIVRWFEPRKAVLSVDEPELKAIIQAFDPEAIVYAGASGEAKGGAAMAGDVDS